jgi:hypothetical protein
VDGALLGVWKVLRAGTAVADPATGRCAPPLSALMCEPSTAGVEVELTGGADFGK